MPKLTPGKYPVEFEMLWRSRLDRNPKSSKEGAYQMYLLLTKDLLDAVAIIEKYTDTSKFYVAEDARPAKKWLEETGHNHITRGI